MCSERIQLPLHRERTYGKNRRTTVKNLPNKRKLWFKSDSQRGPQNRYPEGRGKKSRVWDLTFRECSLINASLSDQADATKASRLNCNQNPQRIFRGLEPGNMGFLLTREQARAMLEESPRNAVVLRPFLMGNDLVTGTGQPHRWVIDFQRLTVIDAMQYNEPYNHVRH